MTPAALKRERALVYGAIVAVCVLLLFAMFAAGERYGPVTTPEGRIELLERLHVGTAVVARAKFKRRGAPRGNRFLWADCNAAVGQVVMFDPEAATSDDNPRRWAYGPGPFDVPASDLRDRLCRD